MDCSPPGSSVHEIFQARIWNGLPFPTPGNLPDPGIKPTSFMSLALAGGFFTTNTTWEASFLFVGGLQNFQRNSIFWNGRTTDVPTGSLEMLELQRWMGQPVLPIWSHERFRFIINTGEAGSRLPAQRSMVTLVLG